MLWKWEMVSNAAAKAKAKVTDNWQRKERKLRNDTLLQSANHQLGPSNDPSLNFMQMGHL